MIETTELEVYLALQLIVNDIGIIIKAPRVTDILC